MKVEFYSFDADDHRLVVETYQEEREYGCSAPPMEIVINNTHFDIETARAIAHFILQALPK